MATGSVLLSRKKGDFGQVMEALDGTLHVLHVDGDRICAYSGRYRRNSSGRDSDGKTNGNHRSVVEYGGEVDVLARAMADVAIAGLSCFESIAGYPQLGG